MYEFMCLYVFVFDWNKMRTDNRGDAVEKNTTS